MVAKISMGTSLYGALAYNGLKVNEGEGRLLAVNRVFDDGSGRVDVARTEQDFKRFMPEQVRTRNRVIHISLNPHPDDRLTDTELEQLAREYLDRLGYGDQPYLVFKHEDISRHHLHIVSVNVDERGRRLNRDFIHRRSKRITSELEKKYGLHPANRCQLRTDNPLRRVDVSQGDVKRQVSNVVKAVMATYKFRTMGEYRALLSLYNVTVEEPAAWWTGASITGWSIFRYRPTTHPPPTVPGTRPVILSRLPASASPSATKPCSAGSNFPKGRSATGVWRRRPAVPSPPPLPGHTAARSLSPSSKRKAWMWCSATPTRGASTGQPSSTTARAVFSTARVWARSFRQRLAGAFTLPYAGTPPMPFTVAVDVQQPEDRPVVERDEGYSSGLGLLGGDASGAQAEEAAFERDLKRRRKKRRKGQGL